MNELALNDFLLKGRNASDEQRKKGNTESAILILQITSLIALRHLPVSHKVTCGTCLKTLHAGQEIEFYNRVGMCLGCDAVYSDCLLDQQYDTEQLYEAEID